MEPIRILILSQKLQSIGGVVNTINTLASNFSGRILADRYVIGTRSRGSNLTKRIFTTLKDLVRLIYHTKRNEYDIIHINPSLRIYSLLRDGLFVIGLKLIGMQKIIVFIHGWNSDLFKKIKRKFPLRFIFFAIFAKAKAIIVLGSIFKQELIDIGFKADKIHLMSTMFSRETFNTVCKLDQTNRPKLLFLSRVIKEKGVFELVDAFEMVRSHFPGLKLLIAGDGSALSELSKYVRKKSLNDSIIFTGYVRNAEKAKVLLNSDIFILPSYSEGCPVSLLEAMAAGLAIITYPVGGIPDVIKNEINGILLEALTPFHIASAINRLLSDNALNRKLRKNARHEAWAHYEAKIVTRKIETIYESVLRNVD